MALSNLSVAKRFAEGREGKGLHIFAEGDTIYSYGYHFPIAKRIGGIVNYLFNTNGYSNTTSKHKSFVKRAIGWDAKILFIRDCNLSHLTEQYQANNNKVLNLIEKHKRAKTDWRKEIYNQEIGQLKEQNKLIEKMAFENGLLVEVL